MTQPPARCYGRSVLNASPSSSPATYSVDGVQYLVVIAGGGGAFDAGSRSLTPEIIDPAAGTTLWVFKLSERAAASNSNAQPSAVAAHARRTKVSCSRTCGE